jgi:hypothetical protein
MIINNAYVEFTFGLGSNIKMIKRYAAARKRLKKWRTISIYDMQ